MSAKPKTKRTYTVEEKAAALVAVELAGGNVSEAARKIDVPTKTLNQWKNGLRLATSPEVSKVSREIKQNLADRAEAMAEKLIDIPVSVIDKANLVARMTGFAIAVDKMRLLRGESTQNIEHSMSREEKLDRLRRLTERAGLGD